MATTGHEHERVEVQGLKASMKKGGNIGIYNDCICSTAAATAAKVTNTVPPSFSLTAKAKILVKFTYGINVANATLQVGENAAKPIYYQGEALDAGRVKAGMFVLLQYDGTNFNIVGNIAKMDAYYKNLHAGLADNLFGSTQTNDVFTFRPTAGIQDIESGDAPVGGGTIKKVEGNGVSWNQLVQNGNFADTSIWTGDNITLTVSDNVASAKLVNTPSSYYNGRISQSVQKLSGHKYYITVSVRCPYDGNFYIDSGNQFPTIVTQVTANTWKRISEIVSCSTDGSWFTLYPYLTGYSANDVYNLKNVMVIDLTLLGIDNLTTVEEVKAWLANNIGLKDYYPYNAGELIPVKDFTVKSVGFNLWDEEWESGIWTDQGKQTEASYIRCKNMIPVIGGTSLYFKFSSDDNRINFFDGSKNYIEGQNFVNGSTVTVPQNAKYLVFFVYGTTYNHDICINLSYDGDRDGEYEEYWEREVGIDVTKVYGKLNGAGESVQVFPDGLKSAGTVHDEIVKRGEQTVAIKRIGNVDLGTLTWTKQGQDVSTAFRVDNFTQAKSNVANLLCPNFGLTSTYNYGWAAITYLATENYGICKSSYTDQIIVCLNNNDALARKTGGEFKTAMSGVYLYYELATPEEYILDENILPVQYRVDNYGTEEVLLGNDEGIVSCSPKMTISYGINAADTIADLPHSYISNLPQQLDEDKQKQARQNINAASQDDMIRVQEQLDAINPKVDNDVYVDMGLPSGLLWAKRNIDVTQPDGFAASEYSYDASYFSWGNVEGHNPTGATFDYSFDATTYASTPGAKLTGNISLSYDAARTACGAPWRMPSAADFQELFDNCDFIDANGDVIASTQANKLVTMNSIVGIRLKSKNNGGILFIPCCGNGYREGLSHKGDECQYASSSTYSSSACYKLAIDSSTVVPKDHNVKYVGLTIRPVM